jgi:hypothetical protein
MKNPLKRTKSEPVDEPKPDKRPHTVTVFERLDTNWGWHEKGANGEITCSAESFVTKAHAERAAKDHCEAKRVFDGS